MSLRRYSNVPQLNGIHLHGLTLHGLYSMGFFAVTNYLNPLRLPEKRVNKSTFETLSCVSKSFEKRSDDVKPLSMGAPGGGGR
jgi:hypothetical protein